MAQAPTLLDSIADRLGLSRPGDTATIHLQEHSAQHGITDIEVRAPGKMAWIFEAKAGFNRPTDAQLNLYAARLGPPDAQTVDRRLIILARADRRDFTLRLFAPDVIGGIPVAVLSWGEVIWCARQAMTTEGHIGRRLLGQFIAYLEKVLDVQIAHSNEVYVVALNEQTFGGGPTTFLEVVETHRRYFHPVGEGWPINPPNYIAFRWAGRLQSIHHVDDYEVITAFSPHFPDITEGDIRPHFLYRLGPPIRPSREVRTGDGIYRAARVYAHIDLLLTAPTIADAMRLTQERRKATPG